MITVIVLVSSSFIKDQTNNVLIEAPSNPLQNIPIPESMNDNGQTYKINTQCEVLFGMIASTYPDGTPLPRLEMKELLEKYPEDLKEWKAILEDPEKAKEFSKNVPDEFNQALIPVMMKESSINPDLKSTAMLLADPQRSVKLKQIFDTNNCKEFFDNHGKPTP